MRICIKKISVFIIPYYDCNVFFSIFYEFETKNIPFHNYFKKY